MEIQAMLAQIDRLYGEGKIFEAEKQMDAWLAQALETGRPGVALTLYNELEGVYRTTGRAEKAVEAADKALALIGDMGLAGTVSHGTTLLNGATACRMAGDAGRALVLYEEAARIFREQGQEKSYQMASLYNNISQLYQEREEHARALDYLGRAMELIQSMEGSAAEVATTRVNMALSLMALGRLEEAEKEITESLAYYESPAGNGDGHRGSALSAAGELAWRLGDGKRAEALLEKAIEVTRRRFGENDACRVMERNLATIRGSADCGGKTDCGEALT